MAQRLISRMTLQRAASIGALALGAATLTAPSLAYAQDRGHDGDGGQVYHNRGDRIGAMQRAQQSPPQQPRPQAQAPQAAPQQAPTARAYTGQGNRSPQYRGQANRGPGGDQRTWTDAQRQAYRNGGQGQYRPDVRGPAQGDRDNRDRSPTDRNGWQNGQRNGWQNGGRAGWQNDGRRSNGGEAWRNNGGRDNRSWDRGWRSNDRYDWSSYRARNRNIYSAGRYYAPYQNYSYRRLGIGFSLGSMFYGSRYWIDDPSYYRLPEAYGPYRWVRYYDDVLLVDTYTGEVVDAIYDFFY